MRKAFFMVIKTETTISFKIPEEYEKARAFEENNKDFFKLEGYSSIAITFKKEDTFFTSYEKA